VRFRILSVLAAAALVLATTAALHGESAAFDWRLPPGFPAPRVPADNPMTVDKVALGRLLFYDTRLSANGTQSCATCHQQKLAFTDGRAYAIGSTGETHARSSMSLVNVGYTSALTWSNADLARLEDQAFAPMFGDHPVELGLTRPGEDVLARLRQAPEYPSRFAASFPDDRQPITIANVARAIAAFERTIISGRSPYDRWRFGRDDQALSEPAKHGEQLFFSHAIGCAHCHAGFTMTSAIDFEGRRPKRPSLFNIGLTATDVATYKAPTLRNIAVTAPYMHDGSIATLDAVLDHYAAGGKPNPAKSSDVHGFSLSPAQKRDLLIFLDALTDESVLSDPALGNPR
jgi:cytochrome c peroxidase